MKEKLIDKLGTAGVILFYAASLIVSVMPLLALPVRGILFFVLAALMYFIPASSAIFWVWGLMYVFDGKQDAFAVIYYVCFVVLFLPIFINAAVSLYGKFQERQQSKTPPPVQKPAEETPKAETPTPQKMGHIDRDPWYFPGTVVDLMRLSYTKLASISANSVLFKDRLRKEAIPFLFSAMITAANTNNVDIDGDLDAIADFMNEKGLPSDVVENRSALYNEFVAGNLTPRAEWFFGNQDFANASPAVKIWAAYGDIVVNEGCAEDYENAPVALWGIDKMADFSALMKDIYIKVLIPMVKAIELME